MDQPNTGSTTNASAALLDSKELEVYVEMSKGIFVVLNELVKLGWCIHPHLSSHPDICSSILDFEAARDHFVAMIKDAFGVDVSTTTTTGNGTGVPSLPDLLPESVQASFKEVLRQINVAKVHLKNLASMRMVHGTGANTVSATPPVGNDSVPDAKSSITCAARVTPKRKAENPAHGEPQWSDAKKKKTID